MMRVTRLDKITGKPKDAGQVCDECLKEIKGGAWIMHPPAEHSLATESVLHLCSDKCLMAHIERSVKSYGPYKSKVNKIINPSKEFTEDQADTRGNR